MCVLPELKRLLVAVLLVAALLPAATQAVALSDFELIAAKLRALVQSGDITPAQQKLLDALVLIDQVAILKPGKGFASVSLGDSFAKLEQRWGRPYKVDKTGVSRRISATYRLDAHTWVYFEGKGEIDSIRAEGNSQSLLVTMQGAAFGLSPEKVMQQYPGHQPKLKTNLIDYPALGISFRFKNRQLIVMQVTKSTP